MNRMTTSFPNRNVTASPCSRLLARFFLLIAGALVTSNDAGLSVPDWPLSYGSLLPPMVGGIFYEHGHRMIATFVGMLSIVLAVWLWRVETRALGALAWRRGGRRRHRAGHSWRHHRSVFSAAAVSAAHATLAQIFFCTVVEHCAVHQRLVARRAASDRCDSGQRAAFIAGHLYRFRRAVAD